ncbi:hypothetical protein L1987_15422 [Smallanthus sonchifolius]|uniref:Uncharacterized protein n=1 Tax=Smallanthus sonchifolius TaxID=185202 RepID=A0ACB9J904_9ASTR|nr:hypothetical protein L1987_15422 [Smallanthus sonchifolius]
MPLGCVETKIAKLPTLTLSLSGMMTLIETASGSRLLKGAKNSQNMLKRVNGWNRVELELNGNRKKRKSGRNRFTRHATPLRREDTRNA